jgi:hypothetical protein
MAKVNYADKEQATVNQLPEAKKFTHLNANELKNVINENATETVDIDASGGVIDLAMTNQKMIFVLDSVGGAKTFTISNNNAKEFAIKLPITALPAPLTFPASVKMSDSRFASNVWTPEEIGTFYGTAVFDGTDWFLQIPPIPAV